MRGSRRWHGSRPATVAGGLTWCLLAAALALPSAGIAGSHIIMQVDPAAVPELLLPKPNYLFRFKVPVKLSQVPASVKKAEVACGVDEKSGVPPAPSPGSGGELQLQTAPPPALGMAKVEIPLTGGSYDGIVTVDIVKMTIGDPAHVQRWRCAVLFDDGGAGFIAGPVEGGFATTP